MINLFNLFFNSVENFFTVEIYGFIAVWSAMCLLAGFFPQKLSICQLCGNSRQQIYLFLKE